MPKRKYMHTPFGDYQASKRRKQTTLKNFYRPRSTKELKFLDTDIAASNIVAANGAVVSSLNVIPEGNGESNRVGRKVEVEGIFIKARIVNASTVLNSSRVRLIAYQDKQCNGAAAAITDVLETNSVNSFRNLSNAQRFNILFDKTYTLNTQSQNAATSSMTVLRHVALNKKCSIPIEYDNSATTGAIATIRSNNIGIMYVVDASSGDAYDVTGTCRVRYCD